MSTQNIHIMRTAAQLWELAGPDMWLYGWTENHCAMLQGRIERCVMAADEFAEYQRMRRRWQEAGQDLASQDLAGAASVSMLVVEKEEEARRLAEERIFADLPQRSLGADDLRRIYDSLNTELRQIRDLVSTAKHTLSVDDYGDALEGAHDRLSMCVGCVEGLRGRRDQADDIAELNQRLQERTQDYLKTMEDLRAENRRLRGLLEQKAGMIISDLSAKLQAETEKLLEGMKGGGDAA